MIVKQRKERVSVVPGNETSKRPPASEVTNFRTIRDTGASTPGSTAHWQPRQKPLSDRVQSSLPPPLVSASPHLSPTFVMQTEIIDLVKAEGEAVCMQPAVILNSLRADCEKRSLQSRLSRECIQVQLDSIQTLLAPPKVSEYRHPNSRGLCHKSQAFFVHIA